jgi:adenylate cyclase
MRKHAIPVILGLAVLAAFLLHAARLIDIPLIRHLEAIAYDARLRLTMPGGIDPRIVIVDIDEKSLAEEGRWPWGRDRVALLLDKLFKRQQVAMVGFDVVFAERDESSGLGVLEQLGRQEFRQDARFQSVLARMRPELDHDRRFADALRGRPVVLGYYFTSHENRVSGMLPHPSIPAAGLAGRQTAILLAGGYGANLAEFQKNAAGAGQFTPYPDFDGVSRRVPMLVEYRGNYYATLSLAMMQVLAGNPKLEAVFEPGWGGVEALGWLRLDGLAIPVDENAAAWVPYRGGQGSFRYVSATDILHDRLPPHSLAGAIVLVGTTAPGLMDLRATPVGEIYPGVEIHANLLAGMLDQNIKQRPGYTVGAEVVLLLVLGLLLAFYLPRLGPLKASFAAFGAAVAATGLNLALWQYGNLVMPIAGTLLMILALFGINMSYGFFVESRAKRRITGLFGQYVPPELVDEMSENPDRFTMEGESREMTVLFSDVRGFTGIAEGLEPRELSRLMNAYLTPMTRVIHKHRGTIDKYMGDAIMAFWGAPVADPDHARHAVLAALEMQDALRDLDRQFKARGWPEIKAGIGLNSGPMSVGNMGSAFRTAYTVLGDAVNLGSRLEGLTKEYGVGIIVGEQTRAALPDFTFRELDRVRVKGKDKPVVIFEPLGPTGRVSRTALGELERFHRALGLYRARRWDGAERELAGLHEAAPDCRLYALYLERIAYFRADPPEEDWDGVFVFRHK